MKSYSNNHYTFVHFQWNTVLIEGLLTFCKLALCNRLQQISFTQLSFKKAGIK
jgi:hypothetical protein